MKVGKTIVVGVALAGFLVMTGCASTLFFPVRPAEKAANAAIDDIWPGLGNAGGAALASSQSDPDLVTNTPAIISLKKSMAIRLVLLKARLESGVIGLTHDGAVALHDAAMINVNVLLALDALIAEENKDRATLYREMARANSRPEWEADLRTTFGKSWINRMPSGWFYRDDKGQWLKK